MTRFFCDEAGGVYERASGRYLGRVDTVACDDTLSDAIFWPLDAHGVECGKTTRLKALAVLAIVRAARRGADVTLLDVEGPGV